RTLKRKKAKHYADLKKAIDSAKKSDTLLQRDRGPLSLRVSSYLAVLPHLFLKCNSHTGYLNLFRMICHRVRASRSLKTITRLGKLHRLMSLSIQTGKMSHHCKMI